jgi:hypothetical protein
MPPAMQPIMAPTGMDLLGLAFGDAPAVDINVDVDRSEGREALVVVN